MPELWLPVREYEGLYEVSDLGRVWSTKRNRCMTPSMGPYGYTMVCLSKDGIHKTPTIHRLAAKAFLGPAPGAIHTGSGGWSVDHINECKTDNRACNLQWMLTADNNRKAKAKLTNEQIKAVRKDKRTCRVIGAEYQISAQTVSAIRSGKRWAHIQ